MADYPTCTCNLRQKIRNRIYRLCFENLTLSTIHLMVTSMYTSIILLLSGLSMVFSSPENYQCDEQIDQLRTEMTKNQEEMTKNQEEMTKNVEDMTKNLEEMTKNLEEMKSELMSELSTGVSKAVKGLPNLCICGYQNVWATADTPVQYDSLITDYSNLNDANGVHGRLDIGSGTFQAYTHGYYTVTFSGYTYMHSDSPEFYRMELHLKQNGQKVVGSKWFSEAPATIDQGEGTSNPKDQGSRTVILYLAQGDRLELMADYLVVYYWAGFYDITFCVTLTATE